MLRTANEFKKSAAEFKQRKAACRSVFRKSENECKNLYIKKNLAAVLPSGVVFAVVYLIFAITDSVSKNEYAKSSAICFSVFLLLDIFVLIFISSRSLSEKGAKAAYVCFWAVSVISGAFLCAAETLGSGTAYRYFVFVCLFELCSPLRPAAFVPVYILSLLSEAAVLFITGNNLSIFLYCVLAAALCFSASYFKFVFYISGLVFRSELIISAETDPLTGLLNRRGMERALSSRQNTGLPITAAMLDIDFFKQYNDSFGHASGDECLCEISENIKAAFGGPDDIAVRYGGEEFVVIFPSPEKSEAAKRLLALQKAIGAPNKVSVSIGAVYIEVLSNEAADIISDADRQLYKAKKSGRGCVFLDGRLYTQNPS